jgi:hypothetical protein
MSTSTVFPEENLSLTADPGFGFFPGSPGLTLNNGSYEIVRKLGRGQSSSTWLIENRGSEYVPIPSFGNTRYPNTGVGLDDAKTYGTSR